MKRLLIANRGEIALRIARTAECRGIEVCVIHTRGDEAHIGAFERVDEVPSYLDIEAIIEVARRREVDAIHPGYGFLSERAEFARAVEEAGIRFVGPSAHVIEAMGRKDHAREIALRAGVPVVPSYDAAADPVSFDYPVLVKAAAGGGGKGMRVVRDAAELADAMAAARREAEKAFGDGTLLIEKYVESGRHVEVQVIADAHGNVLHLGERDCSVQRRHQKVLEEAPAPTISDQTRQVVLDSAVALAREVGYTNAGTVEFLVDATTGEAYFLEMNTRLQVEHPVTEMVTGLDLVDLQLQVADGQELPLVQDDVEFSGHAIEARIYAEDAFGGFLPQAGRAESVAWPLEVRVDRALESGQQVSASFDPMLAKVIVHGFDREDARQKLIAALDATAVFGLTTNTGFLRVLANTPEYAEAAIDTAWLDRHQLTAPEDDVPLGLLGVAQTRAETPPGPWGNDGWRSAGPTAPIALYGREVPTVNSWGLVTEYRNRTEVVAGADRAFIRPTRDGHEVIWRGQPFMFTWPDPSHSAAEESEGSLRAPMPGTVLSVSVAEGDHVEAGQTLGVVEAMKMELAIKTPYAGVVTHIGATAGQQVALGAELFHMEAHGD